MRICGCSLLIAVVLACGLVSARAQQGASEIPIFDAHMHYNQEPNPTYTLDKLLDVFKRNNADDISTGSEATAPG